MDGRGATFGIALGRLSQLHVRNGFLMGVNAAALLCDTTAPQHLRAATAPEHKGARNGRTCAASVDTSAQARP